MIEAVLSSFNPIVAKVLQIYSGYKFFMDGTFWNVGDILVCICKLCETIFIFRELIHKDFLKLFCHLEEFRKVRDVTLESMNSNFI